MGHCGPTEGLYVLSMGSDIARVSIYGNGVLGLGVFESADYESGITLRFVVLLAGIVANVVA